MQMNMNFINIVSVYPEHVGLTVSELRRQAVEEFIDETDTFPHTYYSESAVVFNAHIVQAILCGLRGCKFWMAEYGTPCSARSQIRYERSTESCT